MAELLTAKLSNFRLFLGLWCERFGATRGLRLFANSEQWLMRGLIGGTFLWIFIVLILPLFQIFARSITNDSGTFIGFANFLRYFSSPNLSKSLTNTLSVSTLTTLISVFFGFLYAYALTRTPIRGKAIFRNLSMVPLYAPTLMNGIALIYLFGNKGLVTTGFFGFFRSVFGIDLGWNIHLYGPVGIVMAEVIYTFPQAVLILSISLLHADARLYEAANSLGASRLRTFFTVTLPGVKYGLMSSLFVCFTLCFTDFGAPKVVGGNYNVLATEIYKQVIGQQNFGMGATVSIVLLIPTALAFLLDRIIQRRQTVWITSKTVPITPKPSSLIDRILFVFCILVSGAILSTILTVLMASLVKVWPYTLTLGWHHYDFSVTGGGGYGAYWNSIRMSVYTAILGSALTFTSAYLLEKTKEMPFLRHATYFISLLPLALPGLVIGLAYIFFFNAPRVSLPFLSSSFLNPFHVFYGTMTILVICNVVHFYSVCFLTAIAALKQLDREFEMVSASMTVPFYKTFWRVTVPVCLPAVLEIGFYYFVNSMATVSAVIFLYSPDIKLASVAAMNMDDAGDTAAAAAMCFLIMVTNILSRVFYDLASRRFLLRSQAWRKKSDNG